MRQIIVCWIVGLLVSGLAGCGRFRNSCNCGPHCPCGPQRMAPQHAGTRFEDGGAIAHSGAMINNDGRIIVRDPAPERPPVPRKTTDVRIIERVELAERMPPATRTTSEPQLLTQPKPPAPKTQIDLPPVTMPRTALNEKPMPSSRQPKPEQLDFPARPADKPALPRISSEPGGMPDIDIPLPPIVVGETTRAKGPAAAAKSTQVRYGSVDQFETISGYVQQWRKTWRLRYAPVDQVDPFGGSVELQGGAELSTLREGQHVRVRGVLVPGNERTAVRYRVEKIEILD